MTEPGQSQWLGNMSVCERSFIKSVTMGHQNQYQYCGDWIIAIKTWPIIMMLCNFLAVFFIAECMISSKLQIRWQLIYTILKDFFKMFVKLFSVSNHSVTKHKLKIIQGCNIANGEFVGASKVQPNTWNGWRIKLFTECIINK